MAPPSGCPKKHPLPSLHTRELLCTNKSFHCAAQKPEQSELVRRRDVGVKLEQNHLREHGEAGITPIAVILCHLFRQVSRRREVTLFMKAADGSPCNLTLVLQETSQFVIPWYRFACYSGPKIF